MNDLQPIETAPKDRQILAWCDHEADPYTTDGGKTLTLYAAHHDALSHAGTGWRIIEWGGGFDDRSHEEPNGAWLSNWWFVVGSGFECAANPIVWTDLPSPPKGCAA